MLVECLECSALVSGEVEGAYEYTESDMGISECVSLLSCPSCRQPILALQYEWEEGKWGKPARVYPADRLKVDPFMPKALQESLSEALRCFKAKAYTATAIMCRKTVEGLCVAHGLAAGSLASRVKALKEQGVIESRLFEWADELRLFGNDAAHDVDLTLSADDARDLLEFTHALTEYVFAYRRRFENFKKRKEKRVNAPSKPMKQ